MKHGKNPTRKQLELMKGKVATPADWLVSKVLPSELHLVSRVSNQTKTIWI